MGSIHYKNKKLLLIFLCFFTLTFIFSCSTIPAINVWVYEHYPEKTFKKIFVLVVVNDPVIKVNSEEEFVKRLSFNNIDSIASYTVLRYHVLSSKKTIMSVINDNSADCLLIMRIINIDSDNKDIFLKTGQVGEWYHNWYEYYSNSYSFIPSPKKFTDNYFAVMEVTFYNIEDGKLLWLGQSDLFLMDCACEDIKPLIRLLTDRLSSDLKQTKNLVDGKGFEPSTSTLRTWRSPS